MPSSSFLIYAIALAGFTGPRRTGMASSATCDTVTAGAAAVSAKYLTDFTVVRKLTITRGDSASPFGTQTETLSSGRLEGKPVRLDVIVFDTPRARTVDSSWVDAETLRPLRFQSHNTERSLRLDFSGDRLRTQTAPADSAPTSHDLRLGVAPFEWNVMALAVSALPLAPGYCASLPVYSDRFGKVSWYRVKVVGDTAIQGKSRAPEEVWEVVARADSVAPQVRYWISRKHRVVSRVLVSEPGVSIMYARD